MALANEMIGPELMKEAVMELNASDDRGIDVVRNRIKMFAQKKVTLPANFQKLVILDEADSMTAAAQQALRRTMEIYSATTRFAFACNTSSKIIEPIQSRCALIRFTKPSNEQMLRRIIEICRAEGVNYSNEGLESILFIADGDMRLAINSLQSTFSGFSYISPENVYRVCDQPSPSFVAKAIDFCIEAKFNEAIEILHSLWNQGYSAIDIITTFFKVLKYHEMNEHCQLQFIKQVGLVHMKILEGVSSKLQLESLIANLCASTLKTEQFEIKY